MPKWIEELAKKKSKDKNEGKSRTSRGDGRKRIDFDKKKFKSFQKAFTKK